MHNLIVSHYSALSIYRNMRYFGLKDLKQINYKQIKLPNLSKPLITFSDIPNSAIEDSKLHILIFSQKNIRHIKDVDVHCCNNRISVKSFVELNNDILIPKPELLFCQMSRLLSFEQLCLLGMEMCGTYTFDNNRHEQIRHDVRPLSNSRNILNYAKHLQKNYNNFQGIRKALQAAQIVADNSASPQESKLFIMLCSSHKYGGYSISNMILNHEIILSKKAQQIAGQNCIKPDICNLKNKVSIEYDSNQYHDNMKQNEKDKRRYDAMYHDGWKVFNIVPSQLYNDIIFNHLALDILKANKQTTRIRFKNFHFKSSELMENLNSFS